MFSTIAPSQPGVHSAGMLARRLLIVATALTLPVAVLADAQQSGEPHGSPTLIVNNPGDPNFNQLLGISDGRVIVGYFGDGTIVANNGYVLAPKNHYSLENFTRLPAGDSASQTQAIGINNKDFADIVGFYTDQATGFTHGFLDSDGVQRTLDDPAGLAPNVSAPAQNLLGINDYWKAAGFWTDNNGHEHGFVVQINSNDLTASKFIEISPAEFPGAVATQASDINDSDCICGFWTDGSGNNHGFYGHLGQYYQTFSVRFAGMVATSTSPTGCNNRGEIAGTFTDSSGGVHGFVYSHGSFSQVDAKGASQAAAFGVMGTNINGINDEGDVVGFFSDGIRVNGFVRYAPSP
jgi:hypothetical protein